MSIQLKNLTIGSGKPCFVIAEIGNNHNGSLDLAKKLVDEAKAAGADAAKFQMRNMDSLYGTAHKQSKHSVDLGVQYTLDLLAKFQLTNKEMFEVFDYCKKVGLIPFCTPWDEPSVDALESYGVELYKVASADLTNFRLLEKLCATGKPFICSTGMSRGDEISKAVALLKSRRANFALLHCNSTYPAPYKDINLRYMQHLMTLCPIVGYSGHERGYHVPLAAVAMGACIIEKHFTLDRNMEGVDHRVSLLPDEFKAMVKCIRDVESALGDGALERVPSQGEIINRENLGKSIVASAAIRKGETIRKETVDIKSPGQGLAPYHLDEIVGSVAKRDFSPGEFFFKSDLPSESYINAESISFKRPWGIPVRFHDTRKFLALSKPDFLEFHLSYGDMDLDPADFLDKHPSLKYTVHAPELFAGDHIVDLVSNDAVYYKKSVANMQRVIDLTIQLKKFFPSTVKPMIVASVGGFTTDRPLTKAERNPLYAKMAAALDALRNDEVEIIPQSTAPFPWHMGGQQYQNLFLYPDESAEFCKKYGYRLTLDVSHSFLACNHLKIDPKEFFTIVAPYTAHLHLGDAKGVDGEGFQIGEGEIDFKLLCDIFNKHCPHAWFIPEIWQGHKNNGEGFWIGLNRLKGLL